MSAWMLSRRVQLAAVTTVRSVPLMPGDGSRSSSYSLGRGDHGYPPGPWWASAAGQAFTAAGPYSCQLLMYLLRCA